ncbi:hypothetical protein [Corynebacterium hindlerae]|uniref:hypothetical protein n=1 Tax=Corynebacterium hindlerae TaxID=699041 RepID=UPI0031B6CC3E
MRDHKLELNGHRVTICPNCLSMALRQAEMLGQRAYPIKTIMREMDAPKNKRTQNCKRTRRGD